MLLLIANSREHAEPDPHGSGLGLPSRAASPSQFKGICFGRQKQEWQAACAEVGVQCSAVQCRLARQAVGADACEHATAPWRPSRASASHLRTMRGGWRKHWPIQPAGAEPRSSLGRSAVEPTQRVTTQPGADTLGHCGAGGDGGQLGHAPRGVWRSGRVAGLLAHVTGCAPAAPLHRFGSLRESVQGLRAFPKLSIVAFACVRCARVLACMRDSRH